MEPIPETADAIIELQPYVEENQDLLADLKEAARRVTTIAPGCLGISIATEVTGVTFTLVATHVDVAALDAVQYATSGPCVDAIDEELSAGPLDEHRWQTFARSAAAEGVGSTLTLPVVSDEGKVIGTVNLYGAEEDTFVGKHAPLAAVFDAWAAAAVTNADLSFSTRRDAQAAPQQLRDDVVIDTAAGWLAANQGIDSATARQRILDAADRAGVPPVIVARILMERGEDPL